MMNREIKFRGKSIETGEWVYGAYIELNNSGIICTNGIFAIMMNGQTIKNLINNFLEFVEVIPESVGQFTGLKDKNGKYVYEGDILYVSKSFNARQFPDSYYEENILVSYEPGSHVFITKRDNHGFRCDVYTWPGLLNAVIIGNQSENPELFETKQ